MPTDFVVDVNNSDDIVIARQAGHELARRLGFSLTDVTMIATAISEIARNITSYAGRGEVRVGVQYRDGRKALVVRAEEFETRRELAKIGKPLDRAEWGMTPVRPAAASCAACILSRLPS